MADRDDEPTQPVRQHHVEDALIALINAVALDTMNAGRVVRVVLDSRGFDALIASIHARLHVQKRASDSPAKSANTIMLAAPHGSVTIERARASDV